MLELFESNHGVTAIVVMLAISLLFKVGEFVFEMFKEKTKLSDESIARLTIAIELNTKAIQDIQKEVVTLPKMRLDIRRFYLAVKLLSGDKWSEMRETLMSEDM